MTVEEIKEKCESLSNDELYTIVNNKIKYNYTIVSTAQAELKRRNVSKDEHKSLKKEQTRRSKIIEGDIDADVLMWEKILFFFIPLPRLHRMVIRDYKNRGFVLKVKQASYFTIIGFVSFFLLMAVAIPVSYELAGILWLGIFLAAYLFNSYYFKQRTIRRLAERME